MLHLLRFCMKIEWTFWTKWSNLPNGALSKQHIKLLYWIQMWTTLTQRRALWSSSKNSRCVRGHWCHAWTDNARSSYDITWNRGIIGHWFHQHTSNIAWITTRKKDLHSLGTAQFDNQWKNKFGKKLELTREHFRAIIFNNFRRWLSHECIDEPNYLFGDKAPSYSTVKNWFNKFNCGRRSLKDEVHEGRPKTAVVSVNFDAVRELIMHDRHVTYREIKASLGISFNIAWIPGRKKDLFSLKKRFVSIGVKKYWKNMIAVLQKTFVRSSQVTNHGLIRMSLKQNNIPPCGSLKTSQSQRKLFVEEAADGRLFLRQNLSCGDGSTLAL